MDESKRILFYDGDCGLCSHSVRFMMSRDHDRQLFFAPLQGATANSLLDPNLRQSLSTIVYRRGSEAVYLRSDAVLHALADIGGALRFIARAGLWIPRSWRDWAYRRIARNRHRLIKKSNCRFPTAQEREQLLS